MLCLMEQFVATFCPGQPTCATQRCVYFYPYATPNWLEEDDSSRFRSSISFAVLTSVYGATRHRLA